jgi:saccharopine dehydrogenase (NAD+, L-lysine-forming)
MSIINIGIIREGKTPPDFRVPLSPEQCKTLQENYPQVNVTVQNSPIRCFPDEAYRAQGITVHEDLSHCDILLGVKEVPKDQLLANKTYLFFSHTIKKQPYNRALLQAILDKKIRLIDYEVLKDKQNKRIIGFGRYAGIVGAYNAFLTLGLQQKTYDLKAAHLCHDRKEVEQELQKVQLPKNFRCVLTGFGKVGHGAREIIALLPMKEVSPEAYLQETFDEPVFTHLDTEDYFKRSSDGTFDKGEFYANPEKYQSVFGNYAQKSDMYIPCHFWSSKSPLILTQEMLRSANNRIKLVADISCDIAGPVASTIRPSKIGDSIYGYDPQSGTEVPFDHEGAIAVMAVDNLPCELPKDASIDFGNQLLKNVFPPLLNEDPDQVIYRGTETTFEGKLNEPYLYLTDYLNENH